MNILKDEKRSLILRLLVEGNSMRAASRIADVSINTVAKLVDDAGAACAEHHDQAVRGIAGRRRIECDEIWAFVYAKQKNVTAAKSAPKVAGDIWAWTAIDADSKLIVSYLVGERTGQAAIALMDDLCSRLEDRPQISTDGLRVYVDAVEGAFGGDVDFAQVVKDYASPEGQGTERRYSPATCTKITKNRMNGDPDMRTANTSYVERHNLTMRMGMRRFTRLTNGFSKRVERHAAMLSIYLAHYNFCRLHKTIRVTPAMEAGLADTVYDIDWMLRLVDARTPKPNRPKTYRKRNRENPA